MILETNIKMNRWSLILVPVDVVEGSIIKVAATFDAPETMPYQEIIDKIKKAAMPATGLNQIITPRTKKRGIRCPIQIQEIPDENSEHWVGIPKIVRSRLIPLAVFDTQGEFAALIGVSAQSVTSAVYNARRSVDKSGSVKIKGFTIARLQDVYKD